MVILVGHARDEHCDHLEEVLRARGRERTVRVSLGDLPEGEFSLDVSGRLTIGDIAVDRRGCSGIWRRPGTPSVGTYREEYADFVQQECRDAFLGALTQSGVSWITDPLVIVAAELKLVQLRTAVGLGVEIPATVVTNCRREAVEFARQHGRVVVKPVRYGLVAARPTVLVAWTTSISPEDLENLAGSPVIVQEQLVPREHLRVVTVGEHVFAARLPADGSVDWRSNPENHVRFQKVESEELPRVAKDAVKIAAALHLGFSAQDWITTRDGRTVFLEANPNGQWLFMDRALGGAIGQAVAGELERLATMARA
jgi:glutathione synthase/RimK-type ligase-like ATP-grasp enzyme